MPKKNQNKTSLIKQIILYTILAILVILIVFAEDIIKLTNKNKTNLAQNQETDLISNEPNAPKISAGMIPIKYNGENWIITTIEDTDWYNYKTGQPAYVMLNDGYYRSEIEQGLKEEQLMENNINTIVPNNTEIIGSIYMWIPRFAYKETGEIGYIKESTTPGEDWIVPELFMYKVENEKRPDFSLSGIWVEKEINNSVNETIAEMNEKFGLYGFIANTKPMQINSNDINVIQKHINTLIANDVGNDALVVPLTEPTNPNRIILKIINTNKYEPIKAKIAHNKEEQKIEISITFTANGISRVIDEYGEELTVTEENELILAKTKYALASGTHTFTIIDKKGNKKQLSIAINVDSFYKVAYTNGIDNMDNTATYNKTQETKTNEEEALLKRINRENTTNVRAIKDINEGVTAIRAIERTNGDEQVYLYGRYNNFTYRYNVREGTLGTSTHVWNGARAGYTSYQIDSETGYITFSNLEYISNKGYVYYIMDYKSSTTPKEITVKVSSFKKYERNN